MAFQYSLQKIVDLKIREKSLAEWNLSKAISLLVKGETALDKLMREKERIQKQLANPSGEISVFELQQLENCLLAVEEKIKEQQKEVMSAQTQVDQEKHELKLKMIDEKLWSQAREKAYVRYIKEEMRKEQHIMDDLALSRYVDS